MRQIVQNLSVSKVPTAWPLCYAVNTTNRTMSGFVFASNTFRQFGLTT